VKVDFYEKIFLGLTVVMLVVFMGAMAYAARGHGIHVPHPAGRVAPEDVRTTPPFDKLGVHEVGDLTYEVNLIAGMWQFEPYFDKAADAIRIPTGATVAFNLATPDVVHGFKVQHTPVNVMVIPGQISRVSHTFNKPGEYLGMCHEYCGAGHHTMYVKIIVGDEAAAAPGAGDDAAASGAGDHDAATEHPDSSGGGS
jgi:cytochrome c oxidase subunit 2